MLVNLNDVLGKARREKYAVGLFNTIDTDMLEAVISAAEELRAPVIIGTAEILLPYGDLPLIAPSLIAAARRASVPVVVHYDHGLTFNRCIEALKLGFSSVMYDASQKPYSENVHETAEIAKIAHAMGATAEGEIGHVGNAGSIAADENYTSAAQAEEFVGETAADALAVAIGTQHGVYRVKPVLSIERLKKIRACVDIPLVLHGGSGLSDDDFKSTIENGISKVNIFTDLCEAGSRSLSAAFASNCDYLIARSEKVNAICEAVKRKMRIFGCEGKA